MNRHLILAMVGCTSALMLPGCVDDSYDLSDIDTTSRINVNGLVVPMNLDEITLDNVISFDEDSKIQPVTIGGETFYALTEKGTFDSDPIEIEQVKTSRPDMTPKQETFFTTETPAYKSRRAPSKYAISYKMTEIDNKFEYSATDVDEAIKEIYAIGVKDLTFSMNLESKNLSSKVDRSYFHNVVIQMPTGMEGTPSVGTYSSATGLWNIPDLEVSGSHTSINFKATKIDMSKNDFHLNPTARTMEFRGDFKLVSGILTLEPAMNGSIPHSLPQSITFETGFDLSAMTVTSITGVIEYELGGLDIDPISLTDIPDFLSCEGTNILLANPQIYLEVNNPLEAYNLSYSTGLTLTANRPAAPAGLQSLPYSAASPIVVEKSNGVDGMHQFVLSPSDKNLNIPEGFSSRSLHYTPYPQLSNVLAMPKNSVGFSELPNTIDVTLTDAMVPRQSVTDFKLGVKLPSVEGRYNFIAPLALKEGSLIIYNDTFDGWGSEDLDALVIEELTLTSLATNRTPLDAQVVAYPIDTDGNRIPNVTLSTSLLKANSTDEPLEIKLSGRIERLDGIILEARVNPGSDTALSPDQTILFRKIRAKVSGYYTKKF